MEANDCIKELNVYTTLPYAIHDPSLCTLLGITCGDINDVFLSASL